MRTMQWPIAWTLGGVLLWLAVAGSPRSSAFLSQFANRSDTVGSPDGELPPGAQVSNGQYTARLSGTRVELLDREGVSRGVLVDGGRNRPKAICLLGRAEAGTLVAILFHESPDINRIYVCRAETLAVEKVLILCGPWYYHEMIFASKDQLALLLSWRNRGAVVEWRRGTCVQGPTWLMPWP